MDAYTTANATETVSIPPKRKKPPDSPSRAARRTPNAPDGCGSHADASSRLTDAQSVENDARTARNEAERVRTPRNSSKTRNSPMVTAKRHSDGPDGHGSHADRSSAHTDTRSVGNTTETTENKAETVRTRQNGPKTRNSPNAIEIATAKLPRRWRRVSADGIHVYVPWNAPIEVLGTASRKIVFGRVESGDEAIAPSVKGERAGDGDGDGYLRRRRQRGRLKIERINEDQVSKAQRVETTHLRRAHAMQPPGNVPNQAYGVYRPRRRRGRIKIEPINVSRTREVEKTHLGRDIALRSKWKPKKQTRRVNTLTFESRMPREPWRDDEDYG